MTHKMYMTGGNYWVGRVPTRPPGIAAHAQQRMKESLLVDLVALSSLHTFLLHCVAFCRLSLKCL